MPVVWLFALYGLICLVYDVIRLFQSRSALGLSLLVLVQNREEQVEGFVRSLLSLLRSSRDLDRNCRVVVVDLASTDQTAYILERLARSDPTIRFLRLAPEEMGAAYRLAHQEVGHLALSVELTDRTEARQVLKLLAAICR